MKRKYICMKEKIMWRTGLMPESRCQEPHSCGISKKCTNSEPKTFQALQKCNFYSKGFYSYRQIHTAKTQYWKFETNIPRKGIARPQISISKFMGL
jgi:hypothetical protein